jgi:DNA-binding protein HU-beta
LRLTRFFASRITLVVSLNHTSIRRAALTLTAAIVAHLSEDRDATTAGARQEVRMNKQELISKVAKDTGGSKTMAAQAIQSVIDGITRALKKGDSVTFVGFGTFKTSNRKARTARNPQTGAAIKIPKRKAVRFVAGKALKSAVN